MRKLIVGMVVTFTLFMLPAVGWADNISFTSGTPGTATYQDVSGTITAGAGTVTITITNELTNAQVFDVAQLISGIYFDVSGGTGVTGLASGSADSTTITNKVGALGGAISPTGWGAGTASGEFVVCIVCPGVMTIAPTAQPSQTIIGGTGLGAYTNANGSISNNGPHNPFLVGPVTFVLDITGVTPDSTFSDIFIQFGTTATPPTQAPEPSTMALLGSGLIGLGGLVRRKISR